MVQCGRAVLAMNCVLASAESRRGRPLNRTVRAQMKDRWLASFTAMVGALLVALGSLAVWGLSTGVSVSLDPPIPMFSLVAIEGLGLGIVAFVAAAGLWRRREWGRRTLVAGSYLLAVLSIAIMIVAPGTWDIQIVFPLFCVLLWCQLWLWRRGNASAP